MIECDQCGKQCEDWRAARGHVQYSDGNGHGDEGDVPDDYRSLFSTDESNEQDEDDEDEDQDDPDDTAEQKPDTEQTEPSESNDGDGRLSGLFDSFDRPFSKLLVDPEGDE